MRTLIFMNPDDMRARQVRELDDVDVPAKTRDGSTRSLLRYRAIPHATPPGYTAGCTPEMNVLRAIGAVSAHSTSQL